MGTWRPCRYNVGACVGLQTITRRTGEETQKRSMVVRDDSGRSIEVTLWGALVNNPGDQIEQVRLVCF